MAIVGDMKVQLPDGRVAIFRQNQEGVTYSWKIVMELVEIRDAPIGKEVADGSTLTARGD